MLIFRAKLAFLLELLARPISLGVFNGVCDDAIDAGDKLTPLRTSTEAPAEEDEQTEEGSAADRMERLQRSIIELLVLTTMTDPIDDDKLTAALEKFAANCSAVGDDLEKAETVHEDPETAVS